MFQEFLKSGLYLRGWSPKTVLVYKRAFTSFQQSQRDDTGTPEGAPDISKAQLEAWIVWMRGRTPSGCNIYIPGDELLLLVAEG